MSSTTTISIPAGTPIRVGTVPGRLMFLRRGSSITNMIFTVLYTVTIGTVIIPENSLIVGNFTSNGRFAVFNATTLIINNISYNISATSCDFNIKSEFNSAEINNVNVIDNLLYIKYATNQIRRIAYYIKTFITNKGNIQYIHTDTVLLDRDVDSVFFQISTGEILLIAN
jgi:hypothetical protein